MGLLGKSSRELMVKIAMGYLGTPYVWGGDDPVAGFDCSGLVIECLKSVGILPHKGDWTADGLYHMFKSAGCGVGSPYGGCLVFWKSSRTGKMRHVEVCINEHLSIGASGGGSAVHSRADAIRQNAYIKVRPFFGRSRDKLFFVDPFLKTINR